MKSVMSMDLARWMSESNYFYIMHRFDRHLADDVGLANSEDWKTISFSAGVKIQDKIHVMNIGKNSNLRVDFLTIDIAHGYCARMLTMITHIKKHLPETIIIAGNVATPEAVVALSNWGADIVKVGIGQGSPCTTKDKTGFTMPMFTCVLKCGNTYASQADFSAKSRIPIIADGGVRCNGDIAKALVAGADMVMAGGLFAGCSDSPADSSTINDVPHKAYFGSASAENKGHKNNIEGKLTNIRSNDMTYEEKLKEITQDLQSSISYAGGTDLNAFDKTKYLVV
jgi:GMP reductase